MQNATETPEEKRQRLMASLGEPDIPIPTPWPDLTKLADLTYWHKVGIVAQRGTREAKVGRDIAVHAARAGVPTLLYTGYPPTTESEWLVVDETPNPTADHVNAQAKKLINGQATRFVVIERYERLAAPPSQPARNGDDLRDEPIDDPEPFMSWGDKLVDMVRQIHIKMPMLLTTVMDVEPDPSRRMCKYLHRDHPAEVMTDACVPTIVVHRTGPETVRASLDVAPETHWGSRELQLSWKPLNLREVDGS
ncbi:hypothetical protein AB0G98_21665 [Streptomyces sp. NPDC020196]|uniref:hypothetical protein n=1 Tax=Streptomyces sp. NPDC020196 TaxID=3156656 RepID=UPI0033D733D3